MSAHREASIRLQTYVCESCGRRFVAAGEIEKDERLHCACGGSPRAAPLAAGWYEATLAPPGTVAKEESPEQSSGAPEPPPARTGESEEADLGYGKSHGYGPSHGGPTGPGDAPAAETDVGSK